MKDFIRYIHDGIHLEDRGRDEVFDPNVFPVGTYMKGSRTGNWYKKLPQRQVLILNTSDVPKEVRMLDLLLGERMHER